MTDITELAICDIWLSLRFADAELAALIGDRFYPEDTFPNDDEPYLIYKAIPGDDVKVIGARRVHTNAVYLITVQGRNKPIESLDPIFAVASRLIDGKSYQAVTGGMVLSCVRDNLTRGTLPKHNADYRYIGGYFNIRAKVV